MPFVNQTILQQALRSQRIGELVDDTGSTPDISAVIPQAVLQQAIDFGEARVNAALYPVYSVTSDDYDPDATAAPDFLVRLAARTVLSELQQRAPETFTEFDQRLHDQVNKDLEDLRTGKISVPGLTRDVNLPARCEHQTASDPDTYNIYANY